MLLAPHAPDEEVFMAGMHCAGKVRALVGAIGRRQNAPETGEQLAASLNDIARACKVRPVPDNISLSARIARMQDPVWWARNWRRELLRENETIEHAQGHIRRQGDCYVSKHAMRRKKVRAKRNRLTLSRLEVVNEEGTFLNLLEASEKSLSNPKLRRAELMVRMRGLEEVAAFMGHQGVFLTMTTPSRFHRFGADGQPNPKWQGATPKDAHEYLCEQWTRIRAAWHRQGIAPYGFRVAEPHHDGCPHWHLLLFVPPEQVGWFTPRRYVADRHATGRGMLGIAGAYAMEDSPGEAGAIRHRFTVKHIDPSKGSATGYIAKYISKNIDGFTEAGDDIGLDFASGKKASEAAKRVNTWASTWSIRQFQQIGGPAITPWRELRRLPSTGEEPVLGLDLFEGPRAAADRGMFALFWMLQGGPAVARKDLTLKAMYQVMGVGKYGDEVTQVRGVIGRDPEHPDVEIPLTTRFHIWKTQPAGLGRIDAEDAEFAHFMELRDGPDGAFYRAYDAIEAAREFERSGEAASTWTSVNNCTES